LYSGRMLKYNNPVVTSSMGDVISIKRAGDDDLSALFLNACPEVPASVDEKVQLAATRALSGGHAPVSGPSFKLVCIAVVGACLIGLALVKGVTTRWNNAVDSAAVYSAQSNTLNTEAVIGAALPASTTSENSWRRSRGAWAEYIARLERDPFYQYVQREKMQFEARFPTSKP